MATLTPIQQAYQADLALVGNQQYGQNVAGRLLAGSPVYANEYALFAGSVPLAGMLNLPGATRNVVAYGPTSPIPGRGQLVRITEQGRAALAAWLAALGGQPLNSEALGGVASAFAGPSETGLSSDTAAVPAAAESWLQRGLEWAKQHQTELTLAGVLLAVAGAIAVSRRAD